MIGCGYRLGNHRLNDKMIETSRNFSSEENRRLQLESITLATNTSANRVELFLDNMKFARGYTLQLLEDLSEDDWYWTPQSGQSEMVTHIAWQAGHLAMAQYGLWLFRQRGRTSEDTELMSSKFRKLFMKGTTPSADRAAYPAPEEILQVLERVNAQVVKEVPGFSDESLDEPTDPPTAAYANRYGCLLMAVNHEMLHAGQIGLLRRLMGKDPIR